MNTQTRNNGEWPVSIECDTAGHLSVLMSNGASVELEAFKDDCRRCAAELRQQAIADFFAAAFAALGGVARRARRFALAARAHRARAQVQAS